jgi:hypothetical protein
MKAIPVLLAVLFLAACNKPEDAGSPSNPGANATPGVTPAPAAPAKSHGGKY